jgi:hypothetical protein
MAAEPGSIALFFGLDDGPLAPIGDTAVMAKVRASLTDAPELLKNFASESVADALKQALNVPVIDVLGAAWKTWSDLRKFCDQLQHPPGEIGNYTLAEHVITSSHHPRFQLMFDGAPCGPEIEFDVELTLTIEAAVLEIVNARIMKAATGTIQGTGEIDLGGVTLIERKTQTLDLPGKFSFGEGILLGTPYRGAPPTSGGTA